MVKSFQFARLPLIYFGYGRLKELTGLIKRYGTSILLVTGKSSFFNSSAGKSLPGELYSDGISFSHIIIPGEPDPGIIDAAASDHQQNNVNAVIAIGGGSVMDAGKAISAMITCKGSVRDYLEGIGNKDHPGTKIPFIAIPTTSGTGSEATKNAVISSIGKDGFKRSLRHDNFVPDIALIDPQLTLNCPQDITAASGMDCFTQLVESYLSDKANVYTDALALEGIMQIRLSLKRAYDDGSDIDARTGMSFAALTSGICLASAGLGAVHGFASSVGGYCDIPHGIICGTLMADTNEVNVRELRRLSGDSVALKKYAHLGRIFSGREGKTDNYYIDAFIACLHEMTDELKLHHPGRSGLSQHDIEIICKSTDTKNNPVKLGIEELMGILTKSL